MQDLPDSIIGTNPHYPKIVDHSWLTPNPATYDNYPSDNNSVRIVPKLADLWGTGMEANLHRVPNMSIQQLGVKQAEEEDTEEATKGVVQEAKKAMMAGLKGKEVASHLRSRFSSNVITAAREALIKLSEEQGLLGNVYIDASAFNSAKEAEQFLSQHRTRLAQDIIVNESKLSPNVIGVLASRYHKNVLSSVKYDEKTLSKYKMHLVASGKISQDSVIDSKEALRVAFLCDPEAAPALEKKEEKKFDKAEAEKNLAVKVASACKMGENINDEILYRKVEPILVTARELLSKGKKGSAVTEVLRKRYAAEDLKYAARYFFPIISFNTPEEMDTLVTAGQTTKYIAKQMKSIIQRYPLKLASPYVEKKVERTVGVQAHYHVLNTASSNLDSYCQGAVEALRRGASYEEVQKYLSKKMSSEDAGQILATSIAQLNAAPSTKANPNDKKVKEKVVPDLPERETLPDPDKIASENQEFLNFFGNEGMNFDIDAAPAKTGGLNVNDLFNRAGIDSDL